MKKLLKFLKPYTYAVVLAPLLMLVEVVCDLYQPTLLARIVDQGILKNNFQVIWNTGLIMIGIALIGMVGGIGCTVFASIASQNFGRDLRNELFKKVQKFSFHNIDKFKTSSLITRLTNDVVQLQTLVMMSLRIMVRAPLLFIGGIIMAISLNKNLSFIFLLSIPILILLFLFIMKKSFPLFSEVQKRIDYVNNVVRENLVGIRVVRAFRREDYEKERFRYANSALMNAVIKAIMLMIIAMPLFMLVMNLSILAVLWFGGLLVEKGNMQVGEVMAYINYMTQILFSLMMIGNILMFISRASASASRVVEVLDEKIDIEDKKDSDTRPIETGKVKFEHVYFSYSKDREPVLVDIDFEVKAGEIIGIIGTTGSGKSTLVNLIPRLYDVTSGRLLVDGRDVRSINLKVLRSAISMVPQDTILFSGTIKENICWGKEDATDEEVIKAAKLAQAHDFIINLPDGYDTVIGERGVTLSGGQKQRIAIARALIKNPKILILDDATSAVDFVTEQKIIKGLKEIMKNCTTFLIAQRVSTMMNADKIIILDKGRIVGFGTHYELLERNPIYQEIYKSQIDEEVVKHA
ncbi:ABC transporter ATP-binding protein [Dictyoglomus thermophilum]|uniref:ABC transporter, ATP-binding protein n=2 Tax=Dictyoglomus thermophilum TaxID=14 RepID=B5YCV1_DICT6|nr:ABC transporter ATP-binding protein [Dictyoglomus thermophilum]ACI19218.1 ABC transporter, ATP-binding protein [Dictyoglomus thermophilum H-6-12]TYT23317.1 ABC transporter ATP-binding protein [Dictyoglomus thermophilum]